MATEKEPTKKPAKKPTPVTDEYKILQELKMANENLKAINVTLEKMWREETPR